MINLVKFRDKIYKYESVFRDKKNTEIYDYKNKLFPYPEDSKKRWKYRDLFLDKLHEVEKYLLEQNKFKKYEENKSCLLEKNVKINTGIFTLNKYKWEDGLKHYIKKHNYIPSQEFTDFIFRFIPPGKDKPKVLKRINGVIFKKYNKKFLKVTRNQLMIMDALMEHGGYKKYVDSGNNKVLRYSEHSGLLDFNNNGLEKIIVSANTTRVDKGDDEIYMPKNMIEMLDYEYIFHTHPPTPKVAGRIDQGILFEFPSISDVFHFMDHYNDGNTQGSIIMAPEGMYILRKTVYDEQPIKMNENSFFKKAEKVLWDMQEKAISKYGTKFSDEVFYSKISQDIKYIDEINKVYNNFGIHIDYYPRIKDSQGMWVVDTVYLPIYIIEPTENTRL